MLGIRICRVLHLKDYTFSYKKNFYEKMSLKTLRKSSENLQPQMPELQF